MGRDRKTSEDKIDSDAIIREQIRQVRLSFNLALTITAAGATFILAGVGLLYLDKIGVAALTTSSGIVASIPSAQFAKTKNEELQKMLAEYNKK